MILPDVNVLIYAYYVRAPEHVVYSTWLNQVRATGDDLLLPSTCSRHSFGS
jgi:predicted nucleic acid-binding protein